MAKVSLIMATFNDEPKYLSAAIDSIILQSFQDWELIIIDDSNNFATIETIDHYVEKNKRIKVVRKKDGKYGFVSALNAGIELASGEYVGRMDGDDLSHPLRLEKEVEYLAEHPNVDVVGTQTAIIDEKGNKTSEINFPACGRRFRLFQIFRCPMQHGTILMRRKLIEQGVRYDENFKRSEDLELWLRLQKEGYKLYNIQEILYDFRIEDGYAKKRSHDHFKYNIRARKKNIDWRHPIASVSGLGIALVYYFIPLKLKALVYKVLNGR